MHVLSDIWLDVLRTGSLWLSFMPATEMYQADYHQDPVLILRYVCANGMVSATDMSVSYATEVFAIIVKGACDRTIASRGKHLHDDSQGALYRRGEVWGANG